MNVPALYTAPEGDTIAHGTEVILNYSRLNRPDRDEGNVIINKVDSADSNTKRQEVKDLLSELQGRYPGLKNRIFSSIQRLPLKGWEPVNYGRGRKCDIDFSDAKKPSDQKQQP